MNQFKHVAKTVVVLGLVVLSGCANYVTPGPGVSVRDLSGGDLPASATEFQRNRPQLQLPARVAVARVQGSGYYNYNVQSYGRGKFSVVTTRDFETDADFQRLAKMPGLAGVAPLSRLIINESLSSDKDLRIAAAKLQCDLLLVYTVDTKFNVKDHDVGPLGVITLGFLPNKEARVNSTASAVVYDTRTGYIFGLAEASGKASQNASYWRTSDAVDESRKLAERDAFVKLLPELESMWSGIVSQATTSPATTSPVK